MTTTGLPSWEAGDCDCGLDDDDDILDCICVHVAMHAMLFLYCDERKKERFESDGMG